MHIILESVDSQILYELDPRTPILYVLPIENILGKLPVVGDTGTIPFLLKKEFEGSGACTDRAKGAEDGCIIRIIKSIVRIITKIIRII